MQGNGDYIPRQAAREAVWQILNGMGYSEKHNDRLVEEVDAILDDIPAADVRPVVLCRDCEYYHDCGWCGLLDIEMNVNDFCSRGEKRED